MNIFNDPRDIVVSVYFIFEPLFFLLGPFVCSWVKLLITLSIKQLDSTENVFI